MKILLVGSGGREHALAWALRRSPSTSELHAAPGNPGIAALGTCHPVRGEDTEGLVALAQELRADLVVVGPEAPLVAGLADELRRASIPVFGPSREAARIEGSKTFAKEVMRTAGVPTAASLAVARPPCVVKADGLAAGKGVFVCRTQTELDAGLRAAQALGGKLVIEALIEGPEVSLFALCDGETAVALPAAQDFKRAFDHDVGPNTGGMGSYAPVPGFGQREAEALLDLVHRPVLAELARRGTPFVGLLYAGLMLTDDGPQVLEFNCRFGDPETQSVLPLLDGDLAAALAAAAGGGLAGASVAAGDRAAVTIVLAGDAYPEHGDAGTPIAGVADAETRGALVFHAGTALRGETLVTSGGRVLGVTGVGATLAEARSVAYDGAAAIRCDALRFRTDIAAAAASSG